MTIFLLQPKFISLCLCLMGLSFVIPSDSLPGRAGKDFALFIAVDNYDHWSDLRNPVRDAEALAKELREHYGFAIDSLHNPSKKQVYEKLRAYSQKHYDQDAQLLIFFSGHGHYLVQGAEGFFIPRDGLKTTADIYGESYLPHARLRDIIARIPCKHILVALDACYSGAFSRPIAIDKSGGPVEYHVVKNLAYKSRLFLTSGGKERTSDGTDHSPFTRAILNAIRIDGNDLVTYSELVSALEYVHPKPRYGEFEGHQAGGNFYFIGKNASIPMPEIGRFVRPNPDRGVPERVRSINCKCETSLDTIRVFASNKSVGPLGEIVIVQGKYSWAYPASLERQTVSLNVSGKMTHKTTLLPGGCFENLSTLLE